MPGPRAIGIMLHLCMIRKRCDFWEDASLGPYDLAISHMFGWIRKIEFLLLGKLSLFQKPRLDFRLHLYPFLGMLVQWTTYTTLCGGPVQTRYSYISGDGFWEAVIKKTSQVMLKERKIKSFEIDTRQRKLQYLIHSPFIHLAAIYWVFNLFIFENHMKLVHFSAVVGLLLKVYVQMSISIHFIGTEMKLNHLWEIK